MSIAKAKAKLSGSGNFDRLEKTGRPGRSRKSGERIPIAAVAS